MANATGNNKINVQKNKHKQITLQHLYQAKDFIQVTSYVLLDNGYQYSKLLKYKLQRNSITLRNLLVGEQHTCTRSCLNNKKTDNSKLLLKSTF